MQEGANNVSSTPYVITVSSDENEDEDDVQMLEFHKQTQSLIEKPAPKVVKKLSEAECPICFDCIVDATTTSCGHVYCLECLQKSISSSAARGQTRRARGVGLCPMCRESVLFKDSIVLKLKKQIPYSPFATLNRETTDSEAENDNRGDHSDRENRNVDNPNLEPHHGDDSDFLDDEMADLF